MNNPSGNSISSILGALLKLFSKPKPSTPTPARVIPPENTIEPVHIVTARVLLVIYDPVMDPTSGVKLSQLMQWQPPDHLANAYIQEILETSGGNARYQIVQRVELNEFPAKTDGYRYD
jgi:hypothetical protein